MRTYPRRPEASALVRCDPGRTVLIPAEHLPTHIFTASFAIRHEAHDPITVSFTGVEVVQQLGIRARLTCTIIFNADRDLFASERPENALCEEPAIVLGLSVGLPMAKNSAINRVQPHDHQINPKQRDEREEHARSDTKFTEFAQRFVHRRFHGIPSDSVSSQEMAKSCVTMNIAAKGTGFAMRQ
jgi:hypothetical protein